jgi:hypothetical protein
VRIHHFRPDGNYLGWTVYAFGDTTEESPEGLVADDESKCPVSGKRKYATQGEPLATAAHQISTANAPKELRTYQCSCCGAWHEKCRKTRERSSMTA